MSILFIGIAGPSAGGKTSVTANITNNFKDEDITVINYDDYYKDQSNLTMEERYQTNYDHPNAFDTELLIKDLQSLKQGLSIEKPLYDFVTHNRSNQTEVVQPSHIIILEGLFALLDEEIRSLLDIKVYVEADADECFIRRLLRDRNERGRSTLSVVNQYLETVKPMQERFIEPTRKYADVVVLHGGKNVVAVEMVSKLIENHINTKKEQK